MPRSAPLRGPGYAGAIIKRGQAYKTPAQCIVQALNFEKEGTVIRYRCSGAQLTAQPMDERGNTGDLFPTHEPHTRSTYPSLFLKGVHSLKFRGATVNGTGGDVHFVLSPAAAKCEKRMGDAHVSCRLIGDTASPSLSGARRSKKPRR